MELMEGLLTRRSVRQYTNQKVSPADMTDIVKAAMFAPSARNQQVWEFVVITDQDKLAAFSAGLPTAPMAKTAAFAVAVCADLNRAASPEYWEQDCAAAMQNMLLACHAKGIGSVWVGMHPHEERENVVKKVCHIPENIKVHSLMIAGYPEKPAQEAQRFHEEYIHQNEWKD